MTYDQLGCGASDKPDDVSLWNVPHYVQELEQIVQALISPRFIFSAIAGARFCRPTMC